MTKKVTTQEAVSMTPTVIMSEKHLRKRVWLPRETGKVDTVRMAVMMEPANMTVTVIM